MGRYASETIVSAERSRAEIETILERYGAESFAYARDGNRAVIMFGIAGRRVRFELPLPDRDSLEFLNTPTGRTRSAGAREEAYAQAVRQRWRALALVIKAKLEAVETGITTVEEEFLAHIVLPDGSTVGQQVRPRVAEVYQCGLMSGPLLLALGPGSQ